MATVALFLIAGCGIFNSSETNTIKIELDSQELTDQKSVTARVINSTSDELLIYQETLLTNVERRNESGNWVRLLSQVVVQNESIPWTNWYINLQPESVYEYEIRYDLIENLIDIRNNAIGDSGDMIAVEGEYRLIYELIFDEDYENMRTFYSDSFTVN